MVDISSGDKKINITVSTSGNKASVNATPDMAMYYSNKSREWAISDKIVSNEDYSSKYYANESKKQAETVKDKITEVNNAVEEGITNIINQENISVDNVNTAGATQVALATEQATIATNKASEVVASGNEALSNIDTAKNNAITSITNQETTSKTSLIDEGATQVRLIQNEGATQIANVQSTGFYMRDDKLYYINSQGEETEFKLDDIGRIEEQLVNKVDTSNTQWAINACMPDYSGQISLQTGTTEQTYTAPSNGFIGYNFLMSNNNTGYVKVNDITVITNRPGGSNMYDFVSGIIPVNKNDVIKYWSNASGDHYNNFQFYPMKGAN